MALTAWIPTGALVAAYLGIRGLHDVGAVSDVAADVMTLALIAVALGIGISAAIQRARTPDHADSGASVALPPSEDR